MSRSTYAVLIREPQPSASIDPDEIVLGAEEDLPLDFDHAPPFASLLDLGVTQIRVHQASRLLARAARAASGRRRLRGAVVGDQRGDIRRQLVAGEERRPAIGPGLEFGQKRPCFRLAAVMAEVADHAQPAGQGQGAPDPHVADVGGVLRLAVGLLFLTKVQSSSIWTWVSGRSRMSAALTDGTMLSCQCEPVQHAIRGVARKTCHRPQAVALAQQGQRFEYRRARAAQGLEERMLVRAEGAPARRAVVASLDVAERP